MYNINKRGVIILANQYEVKKVRGYTFFFKFDPIQPDLLHIFVRHLTTIENAISTFFESDPIYNNQYNRYENRTYDYTIYWNWINKTDKKVIIITCFKT